MEGLGGGVGVGVPAGLFFGVWIGVPLGVGIGLLLGEGCGVTLGLLRGLVERPEDAPLMDRDLCPCCVMSMALLAGTGEPPSVTLNTSIDFLSGLLFPCLFSIGESTRFRGGSISLRGGRFWSSWLGYLSLRSNSRK